jgi:acetate kinase
VLNVLALNNGSSSLKFGLYAVDASRVQIILTGESEGTGEEPSSLDAPALPITGASTDANSTTAQARALERIGEQLRESGAPPPEAIGHRIVHSGPVLRQHCLIDADVMTKLEAASAFAPLHTPAELSIIRIAQAQFPGVPQVACFDTTFHAGLPDVARVLPIARKWQAEGLHRYGFHGLSCESIVHMLGSDLPERLIIAHLGNGASITAVKHGHSIDTSMGLTPSGGVVMGTRSGDLDPGILIYLLREKRFDAKLLEALIDHESGLLGISGVSRDMRLLHAAASSNPAARLAIAMFCYSVRKQIAAMAAALEGVDMIVFTGGIGENDARVRADICSGLHWLGLTLDADRNRDATNPLNAAESRCAVRVMVSQEDEQIARHTQALLSLAPTLS